MKFCTAINCMDGRVQLPVQEYLRDRFNVAYTDMITEPGPNKILAEGKATWLVDSILNRVEISVNQHNSVGIAIVGHYDCAGNPACETIQRSQLKRAAGFLKEKYPHLPVLKLWVDENRRVTEID